MVAKNLFLALLLSLLAGCSDKQDAVPARSTAAAAPAPVLENRSLFARKRDADREVGDTIAQQMSAASIAFNAPDTAKYGEEFTIQAVIQLATDRKQLEKLLREQGQAVSEDIEITRIAEVLIFAPGYEVVARAPQRQAVSASAATEWIWDLTPRKTGDTEIHISVTAVVKVDGEKTERLIKSFDHSIAVKVNPAVQAREIFAEHWQWLFSTLLLPAGIWLWKKKKVRRTRTQNKSGEWPRFLS